METHAIVIIGSGPAGISTALSLKKVAPELTSELVVLEKGTHPRPKLCGGGLTNYADEILESIGIQSQAPSFPVHKVRFYFTDQPLHFHKENMMRVIRRDEFDTDNVRQARQAGIDIRENQKVIDIRRNNGKVEIVTNRNHYLTKVLIGADGANSIVRKKTIHENSSRVCRLMELLIRVDPAQTREFKEHMAVFDFRLMQQDLQGYMWHFPSYIKGQSFLNLGIFDSRIGRGRQVNLKKLMRKKLQDRGLAIENISFMAHPERWFSPKGRYACPNVLLVGDAAGIEPWFGEGISIALAYGPIAAAAIKNAFRKNNFEFHDYKRAILQNPLGKLLRRNRLIAKYFYTSKSQSLLAVLTKAWEAYFNLRVGHKRDE